MRKTFTVTDCVTVLYNTAIKLNSFKLITFQEPHNAMMYDLIARIRHQCLTVGAFNMLKNVIELDELGCEIRDRGRTGPVYFLSCGLSLISL